MHGNARPALTHALRLAVFLALATGVWFSVGEVRTRYSSLAATAPNLSAVDHADNKFGLEHCLSSNMRIEEYCRTQARLGLMKGHVEKIRSTLQKLRSGQPTNVAVLKLYEYLWLAGHFPEVKLWSITQEEDQNWRGLTDIGGGNETYMRAIDAARVRIHVICQEPRVQLWPE